MSALKTVGFVAVGLCAVLIACGGDDDEVTKNGPDGAAKFKTTIEPFSAAKLGTNGYQPKTGPAQISLDVNAKGSLLIQGGGDIADGKLVGRVGSGTLKLDAGFSLEGKLKVNTGIPGAPTYDDSIPGLKDISTPLVGEISFSPFLIDGKSAELVVSVPTTALPEIKLGAFPGKLALTISNKSEIHMTFLGTCVSVSGKKPAWTGDLTPSGTLIVDAAVNLDVDVPTLGKQIKLPSVTIPIKLVASATDVPSTSTIDVADASEGPRCGGAPPPDGGTPDSSKDDADDPPQTCSKASATCPSAVIGTVRGDIGTDEVSLTAAGFGWVRVHVDEGSKDDTPLKVQVEVTPSLPVSIVTATASCTNTKGVAAGTGKASTTWADKEGVEDARDFLIYVEPAKEACASWSMKIHR